MATTRSRQKRRTAGGASVPADTFTGKVASIDRGTRTFTVKILNAQHAGAKVVLIKNSTGVHESFAPGGSERKLTIPSGMVGKADGATMRKQAVAPQQLDGDVDSDIEYCEYRNGLTSPMIGSTSGVLAGSLGEGASDANAFLIANDPVVGEYAFANQTGIREARRWRGGEGHAIVPRHGEHHGKLRPAGYLHAVVARTTN